jgi:hypothetical protein
MINIFIIPSGTDKGLDSSKGVETKLGLRLLFTVTAMLPLQGKKNIAMDVRRVSNEHLFCINSYYENLVCHPEGRTQLEDILQGVLFNAEPAHRICINSPCCITDRILEHLLEEMISLSSQIYLTLG